MRVRVDAGVDAQEQVDRPAAVDPLGERIKLVEMIHDDPAGAAGSSCVQLFTGLPAAMKDEALRGDTGPLGSHEFTDRADVDLQGGSGDAARESNEEERFRRVG